MSGVALEMTGASSYLIDVATAKVQNRKLKLMDFKCQGNLNRVHRYQFVSSRVCILVSLLFIYS